MTRAIVFDLDGTLIDSAPDIHAAGNAVLQAEGFAPVSFDQARSFIGHGAGVFVDRLIAAQGRAPDPALAARMLARFIDGYEGAVSLTRLYTGVIPALQTLDAQGWRMAICTNKPCGPTRSVLAHFDLARFFPIVIGGDTLPKHKPDPAPLQAACEGLGVKHALFVGDSEVDSETARACGLPFLLFTEGYRKAAPDALRAAGQFSHHAALPALAAALWC